MAERKRHQRIGEEVRAKLGQGSYGYVVPAWDCESGRLVAMKIQDAKSNEAVREMCFSILFRRLNHAPGTS